MERIPTQGLTRDEEIPSGIDLDSYKKTLLIHSPDLEFCHSLAALFQDRYTVITTANPGMLETYVEHYLPDLVLIDADPSPEIIETIACVKKVNKTLPVIMLYVYAQRDVELDEAVRKRVNAVFYKPLDLLAVSQRIDELVSHQPMAAP